jgi:S-adenosylmethionine:tRNA ribosyltransferase-isomerase
VKFDVPITEEWFEKNGHIPLPPYIRREDTEEDSERYQNVYAKEVGSAACPTAGLHFTEEMLEKLKAKNIEIAYVTLHVGLGTFLPVRAEKIEDHKMHNESYYISEETAEKVNQAKKESRPILAVGTTSVRTLESAWQGGSVEEGGYLPSGHFDTSIFIYPGYSFKCVDKMFTNFHTPESTLMMLVSAFAGKANIMNAYQKAVENRYRFFSYGDAMLLK